MSTPDISRLKIGATHYTVEMDWDLLEAEEADAEGEILFLRSHIRIAAMPSMYKRCERLCHETMHGWIHDSALALDQDAEEQIVTHLSPRYTAFLADNPEQVVAMLRTLTGLDIVIRRG